MPDEVFRKAVVIRKEVAELVEILERYVNLSTW
jgi:hypothetical protein